MGDNSSISIGLAAGKGCTSLTRLPGLESYSCGYNSEDGCCFNEGSSASGNEYGPPFVVGDTVGCGLNFVQNSIFYTKGLYKNILSYLFASYGFMTLTKMSLVTLLLSLK